MTPQDALNKTKIQLMRSPDSTFFTTVCFNLKHEWDDSIPTAQTNGKKILFNTKFFMELTPDERLFLLLHETLHVAFLHTIRRGERNPKKFNIAADHVINLMLQSKGFRMPKDGLADPKFTGMSTEEVYNLLPDEVANQSYDMDIDTTDSSDETIADIQDIVVRASIQAKMNGDNPLGIPGEIQMFLDKLLNPKLPWHRILKKYIQATSKSDYSYQRPNRRYMPDYYLPSLKGESLIDIAIAVDTSGSVSDEEFKTFISETAGIIKSMKPEKISLIHFDTSIKEVSTIKNLKDLSKVVFTGRGGTEIYPVMDWVNFNKPKVLLVFTDGDFYFKESSTKVNTIWLIHNNKTFRSNFGKVVHYEV